MSAKAQKVITEARHVVEELREIGENGLAEKVARLIRSHVAAIGNMKRLHVDNLELRAKKSRQ